MSTLSSRAQAQDERCEQVRRARAIARSLGSTVAAHYLRRRAWTVEAAAYIIANTPGVRTPRRHITSGGKNVQQQR